MTEDEYLDALLKRNPALDKDDDEPVTIRVRGLKAIVRQAFRKGQEAAAPQWERPQSRSQNSGAGFGMFEQIFGKGFKK